VSVERVMATISFALERKFHSHKITLPQFSSRPVLP
jgi:hypothetical protein